MYVFYIHFFIVGNMFYVGIRCNIGNVGNIHLIFYMGNVGNRCNVLTMGKKCAILNTEARKKVIKMNKISIIQNNKLSNSRLVIEKELENFFKLEDYRGNTPSTYTTAINCFTNWLEKNNINHVGRETIIEYKEYLKTTLKPRTINTYLSGLRCLFRYLSDNGVVNITNNIKNVKIQKGFAKLPIQLEKYIEIEETLKKNRHDEASYRDYAMFVLAVNCMLREIEISRCNKNDIIQIGTQYILKIQGKGYDSKDDMAVLEEDTLQAILDYLQVRGRDSYEALFTSVASNCKGHRITTRSISGIFKKILVRFGLDSELYTGHSTRHTGATFLSKSGADIRSIQEVLRHKDINTTTIYTHTEDRLNNPMEKVLQEYIREGKKKYGTTNA